MSLIKTKIEKYYEKFIIDNFPRDKKKEKDKQFEIFVNSLHCWNTSSQSFHSNSKLSKEISLGESQGMDSFFVVLNKRIYSYLDDVSDALKQIKNSAETEIVFHFIQAKNTESANLGNFLKFIDIPLRVIKQKPMPDGDSLKKLYIFIQEILNNPNLTNVTHKFELYFYTTKGENDVQKLKKDWKKDLESLENDFREYTNVKIEIRGADYLNNLCELYNSNDYILSAYKDNLKKIIADNSECLIGYITAKELLECIAKEVNGKRVLRSDVFKNNIRLYLGDETEVNLAIEKTLKNENHYFHLYNNGITITTKDINDGNTYHYSISPVNIVNGCQTANSIYNACLKDPSIEDKIKIPVKIIKISDEENQKITIRSNAQNGVSETDLLAITNIQIELEDKFASNKVFGYSFVYRRQNSSDPETDFTIKIDDILRSFFASILQMPHKVTAKFNETTNLYLQSIFEDRFIDLYFTMTILYKFIEDYLEENNYTHQRLKYHFVYLVYRWTNKDNDIGVLEKYFKHKNRYYDSEQEVIEKRKEDYENAGKVASAITISLNKLLKDKSVLDTFIKNFFDCFKTNNSEFFFDPNSKQKEKILYKAVNNVDFSRTLDFEI